MGISDTDVVITGITALPVLALVMLAARPLLFASVDPVVAEARGVPVGWLGLGFLMVLALVVAVAVQVVGVLLIFALLVTPAATAQAVVHTPDSGDWPLGNTCGHLHLVGAGRRLLSLLSRKFLHYYFRLWVLRPGTPWIQPARANRYALTIMARFWGGDIDSSRH